MKPQLINNMWFKAHPPPTHGNSLERTLKAGAAWNTFVIPGPGIYLAYLVCSGFSTRVFPAINKENYTK